MGLTLWRILQGSRLSRIIFEIIFSRRLRYEGHRSPSANFYLTDRISRIVPNCECVCVYLSYLRHNSNSNSIDTPSKYQCVCVITKGKGSNSKGEQSHKHLSHIVSPSSFHAPEYVKPLTLFPAIIFLIYLPSKRFRAAEMSSV